MWEMQVLSSQRNNNVNKGSPASVAAASTDELAMGGGSELGCGDGTNGDSSGGNGEAVEEMAPGEDHPALRGVQQAGK